MAKGLIRKLAAVALIALPAAEFEALLERAAETGARRALHEVGLDGQDAAEDIRDLRSLLAGVRLAKQTAGQTAVRLITTGVFSIMRNPLYFFSLVGVTGAALITGQILVMIALPLAFLALYLPLIGREQAFLSETFGEEYDAYRARVPALWPKLGGYTAPETVEMYPRFMKNAFLDAVWWFAVPPAIQLITYARDIGLIPTLIRF